MTQITDDAHARRHTLFEQALDESLAMARLALSLGKPVSSSIMDALDAAQRSRGDRRHLEEETGDPLPNASELLAAPPEMKGLAAAHHKLASVVAPATPGSVLFLDRERRRGGFVSILGPVPLVRRLMMMALLSLFALLFASLSPDVNQESISRNLLTDSGLTLFLNLMFLLAAAGLGASFASLFQAGKYLQEGTFSQDYEASYWIRYVLGLIAGIVLAEFVFAGDGLSSEVEALGKPVIALLGGFSASAVHRILARLMDGIEALLRGDQRELTRSRDVAARARHAEEMGAMRVDLAAELTELERTLGSEDPQVHTEFARLVGRLLPDRTER